MANNSAGTLNRKMEDFARFVTRWAGNSWAFLIATVMIALWIVSGPIFNYSDTWQLVINTTTTIVTFLMVFLIQRSQNHDSLTIQTKLDELISCIKEANNDLIDIEDLSEDDVKKLHAQYEQLAADVRKNGNSPEPCLNTQETEARQNRRQRKRSRRKAP